MEQVCKIFGYDDLPNWLAFLLGLIIPYIITYLVSLKKVRNIPSLIVSRGHGQFVITKNGIPRTLSTLEFLIKNTSTSTISISNMRIRNNKKRLHIDLQSTNEAATGDYELLFFNNSNKMYDIHNITLNPTTDTNTAIGLQKKADDKVLEFKAGFFRKLFRCPKYFTLQYTAMVGHKRYFVRTVC